MSRGGVLYIPRDDAAIPNPDKEDGEYAEDFYQLATVLDSCPHSDLVTLLLSSCRNAYLTLNALFTELSMVLGHGDTSPDINLAVDALAKGKVDKALEHFNSSRRILRQYEVKRKVWTDREALLKEFQETASKTLGQVHRRDRLLRVIENVRTSDPRSDQHWDAKLYRVDTAERLELGDGYESVALVFRWLDEANRLGRRYCRYVLSLAPRQIEMSWAKSSEKPISWPDVYDAVVALASDLAIPAVNSTGDGVTITVNPRRGETVTLNLNKTLAPSIEQTVGIDSSVATLIQLGSEMAWRHLSERFRPNIGKPAMPPPFVIDLSAPAAKSNTLAIVAPNLEIKRLGVPEDPPTEIVVALAHLLLPDGLYTEKCFIKADVPRDPIRNEVLGLIDLAASNGAQVIVFPEYSLPRGSLSEIAQHARDKKLVLIGGAEGRLQDGKLVDEAVVAVPNLDGVLYQAKQRPSGYEDAPATFHADRRIKLFEQTPIGSFSIVVCSDLLEMDIMRVFNDPNHLPETIFVVARNPYPALYQHFALTDSLRIYVNIAISNVCATTKELSGRGSCFVTPERKNRRKSGRRITLAGGAYAKGISLQTLSLAAIAGRRKGKPHDGCFAVPHSVRPTAG